MSIKPGEIHSDRAYSDCRLLDTAPGLHPVYVVHKLTPGAIASQFLVQQGGGWNCTYVGEVVHPPVSVGTLFGGIAIEYGGCWPSDILLITVNWFCMAVSPTCAFLKVVPDPAAPSGTIEVLDCSFTKLIGQGAIMYANPDGTCICGPTVPVEDSSWGRIKALYGE